MTEEAIKIQVRDPTTDELLEETVIENDYLIICAGGCYVGHTQAHANGTHVLTVKGRRGP